ncbi:alcohol dehydrogenase catalytic domain-containing protein [Streptomyces canus]|uniref:alcohol dehydrogenase catalytic domain-containing protein n=1 Tax=Streptomyces canus TaxID=58343 RepID=UPI00224DA7AC|nr:alcohol dehydrogenase catalytic domain-containing protein [Streptomyces canus]MCX5254677.1 alcohol dehydrogenase catalytic domain-containing protein [Streptomyces canus]
MTVENSHTADPVSSSASTVEGPDALVVRELPEPEVQEGQVLIDVEWAGVVFPDLLQTRGEYQTRPELPFIPGWEMSGTVRTDGAGFRAGDRVAALTVTGGFAQTAAVDASMVFPLPDNVDTRRGAALPVNRPEWGARPASCPRRTARA